MNSPSPQTPKVSSGILSHHYWIILIVVVGSFIGGCFFTGSQKNKELAKVSQQYEQQLKADNKHHTQQIDSLNQQINELAQQVTELSQQQHNLEQQRLNIEAQTQKKREQAKNLTKDEKYNFLINRYRSSN